MRRGSGRAIWITCGIGAGYGCIEAGIGNQIGCGVVDETGMGAGAPCAPLAEELRSLVLALLDGSDVEQS